MIDVRSVRELLGELIHAVGVWAFPYLEGDTMDGLDRLVDWNRRGYVPLRDLDLDDGGPDPDATDGVCPRCGAPLQDDGCGTANVRLR